MKIEIASSEVKQRDGQNAKGPWSIREQSGFADLGKRYPTEIRLRLDKDAQAYPVGDYEVDFTASVYVDAYGNLRLGPLVLARMAAIPLSAAK